MPVFLFVCLLTSLSPSPCDRASGLSIKGFPLGESPSRSFKASSIAAVERSMQPTRNPNYFCSPSRPPEKNPLHTTSASGCHFRWKEEIEKKRQNPHRSGARSQACFFFPFRIIPCSSALPLTALLLTATILLAASCYCCCCCCC
ncbi:hypothetical protein AOQ84DRAFT_162834 [Glonium stellatum]|uniref:Uncharacterized protein n=1 Tax=Glonium stellatum TaxID=574774 RepID=A0A8E2JMN4_9PEZI|nr:hypothetical protein AOQ84DRAFT_162834 [Glonium stellatum]